MSLLGGGSDYPETYAQCGGGAVFVGAINRFCYVTVRQLPPFFEHKTRAVWSAIENVKTIGQIQNPVVRECLRYTGVDGVEIHYQGDLPAWSGMGTSSAFTVGLLNALYTYKGEPASRGRLAKDAIIVERDMIGDTVGIQDQIIAAHGWINLVEIQPDGEALTVALGGTLRDSGYMRLRDLANRIRLYYTGTVRIASKIAAQQVAEAQDKAALYQELAALAREGARIFEDESADLGEIGRLIEAGWQIKRRLAGGISNPQLDAMHDEFMARGATGVKLLGAGGGGFFLVFCADPENFINIDAMQLLGVVTVPIWFEATGSQIIWESKG